MKPFGFILVAFVASASAASADWRLGRTFVAGPDNGMLIVETSLTLRWDGDLPLELNAWTNAVDAGIEVRDEKGKRLEPVLTTGPAPAFQKRVILKRGEIRTLDVFAGTFVLTHSGTYTATGQLKGESPQGRVVVFDLGKLEFTVEKPVKKRPNKSPEPTSCTVMPRASVSFSDLKRRIGFRFPARVTPAQAVAHL